MDDPPHFPAFPAFLGLMMIVGVRGWKKLWQICLMPPFRFFRLSTCSKVFWLGQFRTLALVAHCFVLTVELSKGLSCCSFHYYSIIFCHYARLAVFPMSSFFFSSSISFFSLYNTTPLFQFFLSFFLMSHIHLIRVSFSLIPFLSLYFLFFHLAPLR